MEIIKTIPFTTLSIPLHSSERPNYNVEVHNLAIAKFSSHHQVYINFNEFFAVDIQKGFSAKCLLLFYKTEKALYCNVGGYEKQKINLNIIK